MAIPGQIILKINERFKVTQEPWSNNWLPHCGHALAPNVLSVKVPEGENHYSAQ